MKTYELTAAGWIAMPAAVLAAKLAHYPKYLSWEKRSGALAETCVSDAARQGRFAPDMDAAGADCRAQHSVSTGRGRAQAIHDRFAPGFLRRMEKELPVWDGRQILEIAKAYGAREIREIGEGGILNALWNIAETFGEGLSADMKKIPIRQETIEICELFGIDPYYALSWDAYLCVSESGETLASHIRETGIPAEVIGYLHETEARTLFCGTHIRYLDRPKPDSLLAYLTGQPCAW